MPVGSVAPIKGMLRKKFFFDVTMSLGSGITFALAFWYGVHVPRVQKRTLSIVLIQATPTTPSLRRSLHKVVADYKFITPRILTSTLPASEARFPGWTSTAQPALNPCVHGSGICPPWLCALVQASCPTT